jgi:transcriptional regulator with XRE-family HTH domain
MINEELKEEGSVFIVNRFAENLKAYRKAEKLSQGALAELLKLSPQSISKWERGESYPDIEKLVALSDIFKVSVDCLVGHSNEHKKIMIAVDGGGTKTEFIMFSEDGVILEHLKLGGCNPNSVGI